MSRTRSNQPTCTTPATLAVRGIPLSWSGMPLRTITRKGALVYLRRSSTHSTQRITKQHNPQTTNAPTANPTIAQLAGGKRPGDSSYPGVLYGQRAGALTSFVARSLLLSRPEALMFRLHIFFVWFVPDVLHGRSCCRVLPC